MGSTVATSKMLLDLANTVSNLNSMMGRRRSKNSLIFWPTKSGKICRTNQNCRTFSSRKGKFRQMVVEVKDKFDGKRKKSECTNRNWVRSDVQISNESVVVNLYQWFPTWVTRKPDFHQFRFQYKYPLKPQKSGHSELSYFCLGNAKKWLRTAVDLRDALNLYSISNLKL